MNWIFLVLKMDPKPTDKNRVPCLRPSYYNNVFSTNGCREDISDPLFFFLNLQIESAAAQFYMCCKWWKRHFSVFVCSFCDLNKKVHAEPYIWCFSSYDISLGQKQGSSRNVNILILKCTRWPQSSLKGYHYIYFSVTSSENRFNLYQNIFIKIYFYLIEMMAIIPM